MCSGNTVDLLKAEGVTTVKLVDYNCFSTGRDQQLGTFMMIHRKKQLGVASHFNRQKGFSYASLLSQNSQAASRILMLLVMMIRLVAQIFGLQNCEQPPRRAQQPGFTHLHYKYTYSILNSHMQRLARICLSSCHRLPTKRTQIWNRFAHWAEIANENGQFKTKVDSLQ